MDDEDQLQNPFPSPPSHYTNYTTHNLSLLSILNERQKEQPSSSSQQQILDDQTDVPSWPLAQLEKPRVDWILEDGEYAVYGDTWFVCIHNHSRSVPLSLITERQVKESIPSLEELGGHQLYPPDRQADRRPALNSILRSILVSYSSLTSSLLAPPPPEPAVPEWQRYVEWITILAQNIMAAANDLRPVQVRCGVILLCVVIQ